MTSENQTDNEKIELDAVTAALFEEAKIGPYSEGADESKAEDVDESSTTVDEESTEEPVADEPVSEDRVILSDGTELTVKEVEAGYLRQSDYTKKTQALANERKEVEQNKALLEFIANDKVLLKKITDHISGSSSEPEDTKAVIQVPDEYKQDPFVTQLVGIVNELKGEVTKVKGGYETITQKTQAEREQSELSTKFSTRLQSAYEELKGQVETPPTTQEFGDKIQSYFSENGIDPRQGALLIANGPDPYYLTGIVERIYRNDILKAKAKESVTVEQNRKKRTATGTVLRASGKTPQVPVPTLPKKSDGSLDADAALAAIIMEQQKLKA